MLVPYIWPTSPASFFTGVVVGLVVALLRPIIEHYVDVGAKYLAVFLRFSLIWGSVGLIAWGILRILQQTSSATLVLQPTASTRAPSRPASPMRNPTARYLNSSPMLSSSGESIYTTSSSTTASSAASFTSNYTPSTPHFNPYQRSPSPGTMRSPSPTRMSPTRRMVGPTTAVPGSTSPLRRPEPRIVPLDDPPYSVPPRHVMGDVSAAYRAKVNSDGMNVIEKPIGQNAFRIRRGR